MAETSQSMADVCESIRALSEAVITRRLPPNVASRLVTQLDELRASVQTIATGTKTENFGVHNRLSVFVETGRWPDAPPDGSAIEFDVASAIGGRENPVSVGASYFRDGDEAVGRVSIGHCFEGPPDRVHGGIICAIFDEVMGAVFRATGTPSAFTGELSVRFEAPAPLFTDLEFRAREVRTEGRKRFLEGEARSPEGRFASASATFIEMRPEHFG